MWAAWSFYYSKYVEYLDTAWLVLKGKDVSFLQTFHHFGAPWDVYLGIVLQVAGRSSTHTHTLRTHTRARTGFATERGTYGAATEQYLSCHSTATLVSFAARHRAS